MTIRSGAQWAILDTNGGTPTADPAGTYENPPDGALQNALHFLLRLDQDELLAVRGVIDAMLARTPHAAP